MYVHWSSTHDDPRAPRAPRIARSPSTPGRAMLAIAGALILTACGDDGTGTDLEPASCNEPMSVEVTVNTATSQPVFDWTPRCPVMLVLVELDGSDQWLLADQGEDGNSIEPPVTYGVVPAGAQQRSDPEALTPGVSYDVVLWRLHSELADTDVLLAVKEFTL